MAYAIINNIIPGLPKEPYRYGVGAYEGVVAHATASYAPDENQVSYFEDNWRKREAFVQYFVDWDSIRQTSDINYKAWGAGPTANQRYVHVELCQTKDRTKFLESYKRYVWLLAFILRRKNLGVIDGKTLVSHDYCSKTFKDTTHTDPIGYLAEHGVTWAQLVVDVKKEYAKIDGQGQYDDMGAALAEAKAKGVISSLEHWTNAAAGKTPIVPEYVEIVLKNMAGSLGSKPNCVDSALITLQAKGVTNNPPYWKDVVTGKQAADHTYLAQLFKNWAAKC